MAKILKCLECGVYTLRQKCPKCKGETADSKPPKFSPEDKYGNYRRKQLYPQYFGD